MRSTQAPVAQLDRVVASEAIGRGFESLRARHFLSKQALTLRLLSKQALTLRLLSKQALTLRLLSKQALTLRLLSKASFDAPTVVKASFDTPINTNPTDQYPLTIVFFSLRVDSVFGG